MDSHVLFMNRCLELAQQAELRGDVPVGALIVHENSIIAEGFNTKEAHKNSLRHAEMNVIETASKKLDRWRLSKCSLYVTLEPCIMCAGAIIQSRIDHVVFGALDPKGGGVVSLYQMLNDNRLNHQTKVTQGILGKECGQLLSNFFKKKRS